MKGKGFAEPSRTMQSSTVYQPLSTSSPGFYSQVSPRHPKKISKSVVLDGRSFMFTDTFGSAKDRTGLKCLGIWDRVQYLEGKVSRFSKFRGIASKVARRSLILNSAPDKKNPLFTKDNNVNDNFLVSYAVNTGDTLQKIANVHGLNKIELLNANPGISSNGYVLEPGQIIKVIQTTHVVRKGDSFASIARDYKIQLPDITSLNPGLTSKLKVGQRIVVVKRPELISTPVQKLTLAALEILKSKSKAESSKPLAKYVVKLGDSLRSVATELSTSPLALFAANPSIAVNGNRLVAGQNLNTAKVFSRADYLPQFVTQAGDSLRSVAFDRGTSIQTVLQFNPSVETDGNRLSIGQKLRLPNSVDLTTPTNKSLNKKTGRITSQLVVIRQFSLQNLVSKVTLPNISFPKVNVPNFMFSKVTEAAKEESKTKELVPVSKGKETLKEYSVGLGDTLDSIAKECGTTVQMILKYNPTVAVDGNGLKGGQVLKFTEADSSVLPSNLRWYDVQPSDTLRSVAQHSGMSTLKLTKLNPTIGHDGNQLVAGRKIKVSNAKKTVQMKIATVPSPSSPTPSPPATPPRVALPSSLHPKSLPSSFTYTVCGGDTLSSIAKFHSLTLLELSALNPDLKGNWNHIRVGQPVNVYDKQTGTKTASGVTPVAPALAASRSSKASSIVFSAVTLTLLGIGAASCGYVLLHFVQNIDNAISSLSPRSESQRQVKREMMKFSLWNANLEAASLIGKNSNGVLGVLLKPLAALVGVVQTVLSAFIPSKGSPERARSFSQRVQLSLDPLRKQFSQSQPPALTLDVSMESVERSNILDDLVSPASSPLQARSKEDPIEAKLQYVVHLCANSAHIKAFYGISFTTSIPSAVAVASAKAVFHMGNSGLAPVANLVSATASSQTQLLALLEKSASIPMVALTSPPPSLPIHASVLLLAAHPAAMVATPAHPIHGRLYSGALKSAIMSSLEELEKSKLPLKGVICVAPSGSEYEVLRTVGDALPELSIYAPANPEASNPQDWRRLRSVDDFMVAPQKQSSPTLPASVSLIGVSENAEFGASFAATLIGEWLYGPNHVLMSQPPVSM